MGVPGTRGIRSALRSEQTCALMAVQQRKENPGGGVGGGGGHRQYLEGSLDSVTRLKKRVHFRGSSDCHPPSALRMETCRLRTMAGKRAS